MSLEFVAIALVMVLAALCFAAAPYMPIGRYVDRGNVQWPVLIAVVVILAGVIIYANIGDPGVESVHSEPSTSTRASASAQSGKAATVASLVGGLEERLRNEPDDGKGWLLLAKSYDHLGRVAEARNAYAKAAAIGVSDPSLEQRLADGSAGPAADKIITGSISATDAALRSISNDDTVFIVARSDDGNPMPVAVLRRAASDLPFDFQLDDRHSMVGGQGVSSSDALLVSAKISRTGDALDPGAGLAAPAQLAKPGAAQAIALVITTTNGDEAQPQ